MDTTLTSKQKDHAMIKLITDVMSNPRLQTSIIAMLESRLKRMNVKMATHLVLMAMEVSLDFFKISFHVIVV